VLVACNIDRFALLGVSGGGPFSVASAAYFGKRVCAQTLIGPVGPIADLKSALPLNRLHRVLFLGLPQTPAALRAISALGNLFFRLTPSLQYAAFLRLLPDVDRAIVSDWDLKSLIIKDVRESLRQDGEGMRADLKIFSQPWKVDYASIAAPSVIWQGLEDTVVPLTAALRLGKLIPNCHVEEIPGAGHFWIYKNIERVLLRLRAQIGASRHVE
ncbi:MAG: alpha/beta fold hydrolase, partial [Hyphomicrobiaceae bacterium]